MSDIREQVPLAPYTTLQVGGVADYFTTVTTVSELSAALQFAKTQTTTPPLIIAGGSNLLINDTGYRGLVIKNAITGRSYESSDESDVVRLVCGAGEELDATIADAVAQGYWGLENLSAIPGSVGATPIQNVGAYGVEVSSLIESVTAMHVQTGKETVFSTEDCAFEYRDSFFKTSAGREWVVTNVTFVLSRVPQPQLSYGALAKLRQQPSLTPETVRKTVQEIRVGKFPDWHQVGTAGSFFKNPIISSEAYEALQERYPELPGYLLADGQVKVSLGWILDHICELRGHCDGRVCLYEAQALVLINTGDATAAEIDAFATQVAATVRDATGIEIEREVRCV